MADWLDSKYFRKNRVLAMSSEPAYIHTADSDSTANSAISQRTGFHCQPSQAKVGAESSRMPFS
jgi:hypothetical protein